MSEAPDIQTYMTEGVERLVSDALRTTLQDPREGAFMFRFAQESRKASARRKKEEERGLHVPPFLIASITSQCNLHCAGCYSRVTEATVDSAPVCQLSGDEWRGIFEEADALGISFILLAGGEPMLRRDVIEAASEFRNIIFPIFTNGTYMDDEYLSLLDRCRNLIPILSIEGGREVTDSRRGEGVYDSVIESMNSLYERHLLYGASVTVTTENIDEVTSTEYIETLRKRGLKTIIYVEYVPVNSKTDGLALDVEGRGRLQSAVVNLRNIIDDVIFISFPGDEKTSGGCLAAGRGFFHINSHGGAEPCPFSPFSDINIRDRSLREAIDSPFFRGLRDGGFLKEEHAGGCVLYEKRDQVQNLLRESRKISAGKV